MTCDPVERRQRQAKAMCLADLDQMWATLKEYQPMIHEIAMRGPRNHGDYLLAKIMANAVEAELVYRHTLGAQQT